MKNFELFLLTFSRIDSIVKKNFSFFVIDEMLGKINIRTKSFLSNLRRSEQEKLKKKLLKKLEKFFFFS